MIISSLFVTSPYPILLLPITFKAEGRLFILRNLNPDYAITQCANAAVVTTAYPMPLN
ncbi:MAG: hypothetical protein K9M56_06380 [Victivallales bacterium]|nr:hypothetical protein [Victivallales bacterium]